MTALYVLTALAWAILADQLQRTAFPDGRWPARAFVFVLSFLLPPVTLLVAARNTGRHLRAATPTEDVQP